MRIKNLNNSLTKNRICGRTPYVIDNNISELKPDKNNILHYNDTQQNELINEIMRSNTGVVFTDVTDEGFIKQLIETSIPLYIQNGSGRDNEWQKCESDVHYHHNILDTITIEILDKIGGLVGVVIFAGLCVVLMPAICIESKGPLIFTQERIGKNGKRFICYKFRTMCSDAEEKKASLQSSENQMDSHMFKSEDDVRITKVGKFLRKSSLDEFPQFINVLLGQMSIVGTRPPTVDEWLEYEPKHRKRMLQKPGITGMWQVSGRNNIRDFDKVVELDMKYIEKRTLKNYITILFKTVASVVHMEGA